MKNRQSEGGAGVKGKSRLSLKKIRDGLETSFIGRKMFYFKEVASTNDLAKEHAAKGVEEGTVVITESQTRGKGRFKRRWISPKGGIWFSVILRPSISPKDAPKIMLMASVAVAKTIRKMFKLDAKTKWPNDILINSKKVCGILAETSICGGNVNFVVLGVGINANINLDVFPRNLTGSLTSLKKEMMREIPRERFIQALLKELESYYNELLEGKFVKILEEWKSLTDMIGKRVEVVSFNEKFTGQAVDVDEDGALMIRLENESIKKVTSGDASIVYSGD